LADIASSFRPGGSLSNTAAMVGIYLISEKFAESKKLVVLYWITLSLYFFIFIPFVVCDLCSFFFSLK
jgi:hypothetical protein